MTDEVEGQHYSRSIRFALETNTTTMRFSALTLLIVLPAAAYAAVCPQQLSIQPECGERGAFCDYEFPCCGRLQCIFNSYGQVSAIAYYHDSLHLMNSEIEHRYVIERLDIESARRVRELSRTGYDEFEAWCSCRVEWQASLY
ncbi:hypothetical protein BGW80DRAFT_431977 [Lactifluus volemus]|nr:hypothetical protein BGW80DRAFT_431977 [Lactifluus volemus]